MDKTTQTQIIKLIHQEVIPAIGCTEPVAVALAAAKAAEVLGCKPEKTEVFLRWVAEFLEPEWSGCL